METKSKNKKNLYAILIIVKGNALGKNMSSKYEHDSKR